MTRGPPHIPRGAVCIKYGQTWFKGGLGWFLFFSIVKIKNQLIISGKREKLVFMSDWDRWVLYSSTFTLMVVAYRAKPVVHVTCLVCVGTGKQHTQKTVAIAVGGLAAFGFVIVCLLFLKSVLKRKGGKHGGWGFDC